MCEARLRRALCRDLGETLRVHNKTLNALAEPVRVPALDVFILVRQRELRVDHSSVIVRHGRVRPSASKRMRAAHDIARRIECESAERSLNVRKRDILQCLEDFCEVRSGCAPLIRCKVVPELAAVRTCVGVWGLPA